MKQKLLHTTFNILMFAHAGQKTYDGGAYQLHPMAVADIADPMNVHSKIRMISWLHDVLEDTAWTVEDLRWHGIPEDVIAAVVALTKIPGEAYDVYLARVMSNYLALRVKIADMTHNMDLTRIPVIRRNDIRRQIKYRKYKKILKAHLVNHYG